jgi:transcription antitermination factor NusG
MSWHVLHLRPRSEKKTAEYCRKHGLTFFLPLREETKIYQRRKVKVQKPVFPGYLFASFDRDGRLSLLRTNNLVRILTPDSEAHLLFELDQIRRALAVDPTLGACAALKRGRHVRIIGGPFRGIEGIVSAVRQSSKVRLNVDMIGQAVAVDVDKEYLELAD